MRLLIKLASRPNVGGTEQAAEAVETHIATSGRAIVNLRSGDMKVRIGIGIVTYPVVNIHVGNKLFILI